MMARLMKFEPCIFALAALALISCSTYATVDPSEKLIIRADRLFAPITIAGNKTVAAIDSAAEITFVDTTYAESIGLELFGEQIGKGTGGTAQVRFAQGVPVVALGQPIGELTVAALDLSDISERLIGAPLTVVLGRELFDGDRIEVDIRGKSIRRSSRENTPPGVVLNLKTRNGVETMNASVNGQPPVNAELDLGNGSEVLIGAAYAAQLGLLKEENIIDRRKGGGVGGPIERDIIILDELEVAGVKFKKVEAAVDNTANAAALNLGVKALRNFLITADFSERTIWLAAY
ncbi:MAG: pepsin/retropepsin-like aspartic protease family protein [Parvularculaceae bacterium]